MNFWINTILNFVTSGLWRLWQGFRSLSPRIQIALILIFLALILTAAAVGYHFYSIKQLQTVIESQKEGIAIKGQREINQAKEAVNKAEAESNKIIQTDSNKFSKNSKELTNKFCDYYCKQGVLDSTCADWAKETGRICN